jgi:hypothetical protein
VGPTVTCQGKPSSAIAERAARWSMVAKVLQFTKRDGENDKTERGPWGAHLGQQTTRRVAVVARGGNEVAPLSSGDGGGSMWGSSGNKKRTRSFEETSSSSSRLQLWRAAMENGVRRWRLGQRRWLSLGPKSARYKTLFIGVFRSNRRRQKP